MIAEIGTNLKKARFHLENGGLVAIPTETVYGLAANGLDQETVLKIFEAKNRPHFDPLILHTHSIEEVEKLVLTFPKAAIKLAETFWPGPLTLILPKKEIVPDITSSGLSSVGIRIPRHNLTRRLLKDLPFPLAAPSANPFGYISPTSAKHVADQLGDKVDYILDGGPSEVGIESTIISFEEKVPKVLRWGGLEPEKIRSLIGDFDSSTESSSSPSAPGMLSSHYAPRKRLIIGNLGDLIKEYEGGKISYLSFQNSYDLQGEVLSLKGDIHEAAKNLFAALRRLDTLPGDIIIAEFVPNEGLGRAINDRLKRAAHPATS